MQSSFQRNGLFPLTDMLDFTVRRILRSAQYLVANDALISISKETQTTKLHGRFNQHKPLLVRVVDTISVLYDHNNKEKNITIQLKEKQGKIYLA